MLFHITQVHTPEACPKDVGGSKTLYAPDVEGVKLRVVYGAFSHHVIYYLVEADSLGGDPQVSRSGLEALHGHRYAGERGAHRAVPTARS